MHSFIKLFTDKYQFLNEKISLSALSLFTVHSNELPMIPTTPDYPTVSTFNPVLFSIDTNYHTSSWKNLYNKDTIVAGYSKGKNPLNTNPLILIPFMCVDLDAVPE